VDLDLEITTSAPNTTLCLDATHILAAWKERQMSRVKAMAKLAAWLTALGAY